MRTMILTVLAVTAICGAAGAASRPADPTAELKSLAGLAGGDIRYAILGGESDRVARAAFATPPAPLASVMGSVCGRTLGEVGQGYGRYVARYVREPRRGVILVLNRMESDFRRHVRTISRTLPEGEPTFLKPGETLDRGPTNWEQAARQRAEWALVMGILRAELIVKADTGREYEAYIAAGLWTRLDCLSARADQRFLNAYAQAGGGDGDERTAGALNLLASRASASR